MARGKIAEMVEAEAAVAEAEEPDESEAEDEAADVEESEAGDDGDEAGEPEAIAEPMSAEAFAARLETVIALHSDNLAGLFGDAYAEMNACPLCNGLGATAPDAIVLDPTSMRCSHCNGWGQLATEAQDESHLFKQCPACFGNGYVDKLQAAPEQPEPPVVVVPPMPLYDAATNTWRVPDSNSSNAQPVSMPAAGGAG